MATDPSRAGRCYELAMIRMLGTDAPTPSLRAVIVHGYPTLTGGPDEGSVYGHAWLEWDEPVMLLGFMEPIAFVRLCWDPVADITVLAETYYAAGNIDPDESDSYTYKQSLDLLAETGHPGPWNDGPDGAVWADD